MSIEKRYHFVAISGSLRKASYNTLALKALQQVAPSHITIEQLHIGDIPFYNADLHTEQLPEQVVPLIEKIKAADGVIFVSPEYNYSIPGALKNAIDVFSRHPDKPFNEKAVAILGASQGNLGTARMQYHLRQVMVFLNAYVINKPEVMIASAQHKFDASGNLTDEYTLKLLPQLLHSLAQLSEKIK
ncbi:NADPH-dependent FMN reductase [Chitinophaga nivalis]|uniref:NAD(P)H-dependent oxidoreductase n=1 Tax=Chitinophaga nivalis TaxID=2991709 RepID=A0ABT3IS98_9BACT|nr:NAD(P)H-dependent oxidoreductase [Chitinophaga nivalis]MCW3463700.1 NAD(P)H-dependent oxidoreductase [Chitinophaga nivalis]MCW3486610.1 NAD(P)H-dependent oxidoreductase [Chitinophaga nivalis]